MHLQERLVKIDELAAALDRKPDWIKRNWLRLHREKGMPRKVPETWAWPRRALETWIENSAAAEAETLLKPPVGIQAVVANENRRLRTRYGVQA